MYDFFSVKRLRDFSTKLNKDFFWETLQIFLVRGSVIFVCEKVA